MSSEQESYVRKDGDIYERRNTIRRLNDGLRRTMMGGRVLITNGVEASGLLNVTSVLDAVRQYSTFTPDDDPYDEHDFGSLTCGALRILWKIDYYDRDLEGGSPDPANPAVTIRVLTIMLASEY